ncbi:fumarylacetoacetate hydrolase family protein [Flavobacteriaceae bacterium]|jgi:2-dehydro-3-deoxy-D-arabinonate dehydratase|nr:2-hydroxyhepta-2,4-diene-1,7-dioate isomerase [Flavobacteriaceae bacterium]MDA7711872.1 fumarylacetoacetate hydrolase family protein [Flavobacteriaceae bacterium]
MKLYKTKTAVVVEFEDEFYECPKAVFGALIQRDDLFKTLLSYCVPEHRIDNDLEVLLKQVLPPIDQQEVWAAGVTYYRSKTARMEESKDSGGSSFYDRVYEAARPELFFKSTAARVVGHQALVRIRKDSQWSVPEPELTLLISPNKKIIGYTVGNDMSARDIEGENPLYLPQAKSYTGAAALGPCVLVLEQPISKTTQIAMIIYRNETTVFEGTTKVENIKRSLESLVAYLFAEMEFPQGCFLMTGTGIVPDDTFTLQSQDRIEITIDGIGTLINTVA